MNTKRSQIAEKNKEVKWFQLSQEKVLEKLNSSFEGLGLEEVRSRREKYGPNDIPKGSVRTWRTILWHQIKSPLIYVLVAAALVSLAVEHYLDFWVISAVILINTIIGFFQEYKAEKSIVALQAMVAPRTKVIRDSELRDIPAIKLVPGDIISLESGDQVPADARVLEAVNCRLVESSLTGESTSTEKQVDALEEDASLADQTNMVWEGTHLVSGSLKAVVVATGRNTALGRIASSLEQKDEIKVGHFESKTSKLAKKMGGLAVLGFIAVFIIGYLYGEQTINELFLFSLAVLVSGIPEGLPAILTIVLSIGAHRMARRSVVTKRLPAIETIGSVDTIVTDKTGTLTQNKMTVKEIQFANGRNLHITGEGWQPKGEFKDNNVPLDTQTIRADADLNKLLHIGVWGTGAHLVKSGENNNNQNYEIIGEPTEAALVVLGAKADVEKEADHSGEKKLENIPFNQESHFRGAVVKLPDQEETELYIVGAPYKIVSLSSKFLDHGEEKEISDEIRQEMQDREEKMSGQALRVIALAYRKLPSDSERSLAGHVDDLVFVGFVGMKDPARPGVKDAIDRAKKPA